MDVFDLIVMSAKIYASRIPNYTYASIAYLLSIVVAAGIAAVFLIVNGAVALVSGPSGEWIVNPFFAFVILLSTCAGGILFCYIYFAASGAYMHLCAQIGAGQKDAGISEYVEYMICNSHVFFAISALPAMVSVVVCAIILAICIFVSQVNAAVAGMLALVAVVAVFFVHAPFWFSYAARVVSRTGAVGSLTESVNAIVRSPIAAIAVIGVLCILAIAPVVVAIFYPIYFFMVFCPFACILTLAYYEAVRGMIGKRRK